MGIYIGVNPILGANSYINSLILTNFAANTRNNAPKILLFEKM